VVTPTVSELGLLNDTGEFDDDDITADPTLQVQLTGDEIAFVKVEFDHENDGSVDGQTVSDGPGALTYYVSALTSGAVTVNARTRVRDDQQGSNVTSAWVSFSFTKEASTHSNFALSGLSLVNDTGANGSDRVTFDRRVTGTLSGDGHADYIIAELDQNSDGVADGSVRNDAFGEFIYYASGISLRFVMLSVRTKEWISGTAWRPTAVGPASPSPCKRKPMMSRKSRCWNFARTRAQAART
jgi:hypothetical protein